MNIRNRIILLVVLTFIAITLIGGLAVYQSRKNAAEVRSVTEGVVPSALASADLVSQFKAVQLATMALIFEPNADLAKQARDKLAERKKQLLSALDLQVRQASNAKQKGLVGEIEENAEHYFASIDDAVTLKIAGQTDLAVATLAATAAQYQRETEEMVDALRVEKYRSKDDAIASLNENLKATTLTTSSVTVVAVIVLTVLGALLYRQIAGPIGRMQAMMSEIAGSQDFTRRVPVDRDDEIGRSIRAFNAMIERIEERSGLLRQKTADIQTMLQNIPQGILTIAEGNRVHPEYSAYLETILETKDIVGRPVMELVFADIGTGSDVLAQIEAAVSACIGEDIMNFEFNRHLLVGEIEKRLSDGKAKVLDLNWSPIADETGRIVRLMLCVRDVTELRQLAAEAREQERTLATIGEILAVSQEKFHEFVINAMEFVDQNEVIIHRHAELDADAVAQLFRNMHTIKGNARTYGLRHLTNVVHEAEQIYDALRKPYPDIAWDQAMLVDSLAQVRGEIERYARINEVSLGRKGPGRRGNVERYLLVDKQQIHQALHHLETINTANIHELLSARNHVRQTLRLLGTEPLGEILSGVLDSLPSLARELGKVEPTVTIEDGGYVIRNQVAGLLKNVFMHLIRNSVDHGIETSDVRSEHGKPPGGTIRLDLSVAGGRLGIAVSDDGRGLALGRIRQLGIERGLIDAGSGASDEEVAALVFRPAFSTAEKVTEVSGRGVGMDAVQDFVKREGGTIEIRFTDGAIGADYRPFRTVVSLPDSVAVKVDTA
jgi:two-component system chemotaxis sensor kinase CheA